MRSNLDADKRTERLVPVPRQQLRDLEARI
jgi:hypothetical protein